MEQSEVKVGKNNGADTEISEETSILIGEIVSTDFLRQTVKADIVKYLSSKYSKLLHIEIVKHFETYSKAPGSNITEIVEDMKGRIDPTIHTLIVKVVEYASERYGDMEEPFSLQFNLDSTEKYLLKQALKLRREEEDKLVKAGKFLEAAQLPPAVINLSKTKDDIGKGYTGAELLNAAFAETKWVVEDLFTEGFSPLGGPPKVGKSWYALDLCISVATGKPFLNRYRAEKGSALYLDFEQPDKKLKARLKKILGNNPDLEGIENLHLYPKGSWPRIHQGGMEKLEEFVKEHPDLKLVVIDVWKKFSRPRKINEENSYNAAYEDVSPVKDFADRHGILVLVIHHLAKGWRQYDSPLEAFLGSTGLAGASDNLFALVKGQGEADGVLWATGRDIEESQTALEFFKDNCTWRYLGEALQFELTQDQNAIIQVISEFGQPMSPKMIADALKKDANNITQILFRMVKLDKLIRTGGYGKYFLPGKSINTNNSDNTNNNNNRHNTHNSPLEINQILPVKNQTIMGITSTKTIPDNSSESPNPPNSLENKEDIITIMGIMPVRKRQRNWDDLGEAVSESYSQSDRV